MSAERDNVVLIGMPGAGKSTVGVILAKRTSRAFVDTDVLIQTRTGRSLQDIVDGDGYLALRDIEEQVMLGLDCGRTVIATGGSAVYSERAMAHLKAGGPAVFLDVDLPTLLARVRDEDTRGLARAPGQGFEALYRERTPLYRRYADLVVPTAGLTQEDVCTRIERGLDESDGRN